MTAAGVEPVISRADVPTLSVESVTVRADGIRALDDVSFTVRPGTIHALIGPNGAGKSTCFNVITGVYRGAGRVLLGDTELTALPTHRIARLGVARTFQNLALAPRMTVEDNLMLGRHHLTRSGFMTTGLRLPMATAEERRHRARVREIADFLGLAGRLASTCGLLPYGDRKRVELARALCSEPRLLLVDEPVAGMVAAETEEMSRALVAVRRELGVSILLVEHDMGMVMQIADWVTVLDFGRRIADGPPDVVQGDPEVIRAYLGAGDDAAADVGRPLTASELETTA